MISNIAAFKTVPGVLNIEINSIGIHGEFYIATASPQYIHATIISCIPWP